MQPSIRHDSSKESSRTDTNKLGVVPRIFIHHPSYLCYWFNSWSEDIIPEFWRLHYTATETAQPQTKQQPQQHRIVLIHQNKGGIQSKWNRKIIWTSENNKRRQTNRATEDISREHATRATGVENLYLGLCLHCLTKGDTNADGNNKRSSSSSYLKGWSPKVCCGESFVKGCARITYQGLNCWITQTGWPLLNAQKLNTHTHTHHLI